MGEFDLALTLIFVPITIGSLALAAYCIRKALNVSGERDGDFKMFLWAVGSLVCLVIGGMTFAYILLPLLFAYI